MLTLPVLWFAADYGRVIHIHASSLTVLLLAATQHEFDAPTLERLRWQHVAIMFGCVFFVGSWRLVHWNPTLLSVFRVITLAS